MKSKNLHVRLMPTIRAWWPSLVVAVGIFVASSTPGSAVPGLWPPGADKVVHLSIYALLGALVARSLTMASSAPVVSAVRLTAWAALLATGYGVTDELHQLFVPGRRFELADLAADALGALLGALVMARVCARRATASLPSRRPP